MRSTLIGKMDGENIVVLPESHYIVMSSDGLDDDIIEVLGRIYKVTACGNIDITQEYCKIAGWHGYAAAIEYVDVMP